MSESISLGEKKCSSLLQVFRTAVVSNKVKIRTFARWIGLCISILPCFPHSKMHYRHLEHSKIKALKKVGFKWNKTMIVSNKDRKILSWWLDIIEQNSPYKFHFPPISAWMETDSSQQSWGCSLIFLQDNISLHRSTGFRFGHSESHHPINSKELLAIYYSLLTFKEDLVGHHISLKSDSTTAIADVRKMGSMCSTFRDEFTQKIYQVLFSIDARLTISFLRGCDNTAGDEKSRVFTSTTPEWTLDSHSFSLVQSWVPDMNFDLFASHLNNKLPQFCSWMPTPGCFHTDAFTFDWNSRICYCFPPSSLYLKCFDHIRTRKIERIYFIVPVNAKSSSRKAKISSPKCHKTSVSTIQEQEDEDGTSSPETYEIGFCTFVINLMKKCFFLLWLYLASLHNAFIQVPSTILASIQCT